MKELIKKLFNFSIGPIVVFVIGVISIPITTYFVSPHEYGKVAMFSLSQSVLGVTLLLGLEQSYVRFFNDEINKKRLLQNTIIIPLLLSIVLLVIVVLFPGFFSKLLFDSPKFTTPIYLLAVTIPLLVFQKFILLSIRMNEHAKSYSFFLILTRIITFISTIIYITLIRTDFLAIVYSTIIGQVVGDAILIVIYRKEIKFNYKQFDKTLIKKLLKYGLPLLIVSVIGWGLNSIDKIFIRIYSTFAELGLYNASLRISNLLLTIQTCFTTFWVPIAYRWYKEKVDDKKFTLISEIVSFVMALLFMVILLCKDLFPILISNNYKESIYIMPFLLLYPIMYTMSETTTLGIPFSKKSYLNIIISIISISTNLILNFLLVPKFGAIGAAIGTGFSYIVFFWSRTLISRKLWYKFSLRKYFIITVILFLAALLNSLIKSPIYIYSYNIIFILIIIIVNNSTIIRLIELIKKLKQDKINYKNHIS